MSIASTEHRDGRFGQPNFTGSDTAPDDTVSFGETTGETRDQFAELRSIVTREAGEQATSSHVEIEEPQGCGSSQFARLSIAHGDGPQVFVRARR